MFTFFISANIEVALQKSYPALLVLRMLQSAGSSGEKLRFRILVRDVLPIMIIPRQVSRQWLMEWLRTSLLEVRGVVTVQCSTSC